MKLATYRDGSRDGQLVVVSRDLSTAHYATGIATRLQQVLDDWNFLSPQLQDLYVTLNQGKTRHAFAFNPAQCMAPLPRAHQWVDGGAYPHHRVLLDGSGQEAPALAPTLRQGGSDRFLGPCEDLVVATEDFGIDFEPKLVAVTGDVGLGTAPEEALERIRLMMLANDFVLRHVAPSEQALGQGFVLSRPATAFSPVAVTPDELEGAWHAGRVHLSLQSRLNGRPFGRSDTGLDMDFHFGHLIAHLCKTRRASAGTLVGSGPVSNREAPNGPACLAEKRAREIKEQGQARTGYLRYGDTIHLDIKNAKGQSVFGEIEQVVAGPQQD